MGSRFQADGIPGSWPGTAIGLLALLAAGRLMDLAQPDLYAVGALPAAGFGRSRRMMSAKINPPSTTMTKPLKGLPIAADPRRTPPTSETAKQAITRDPIAIPTRRTILIIPPP